MSLIVTKYNPEISNEAKEWIENNIIPEMTNQDGDEHSYRLENINTQREKGDLSRKDVTYIRMLEKVHNVEYLEF